jgi:hypothetical protein
MTTKSALTLWACAGKNWRGAALMADCDPFIDTSPSPHWEDESEDHFVARKRKHLEDRQKVASFLRGIADAIEGEFEWPTRDS